MGIPDAVLIISDDRRFRASFVERLRATDGMARCQLLAYDGVSEAFAFLNENADQILGCVVDVDISFSARKDTSLDFYASTIDRFTPRANRVFLLSHFCTRTDNLRHHAVDRTMFVQRDAVHRGTLSDMAHWLIRPLEDDRLAADQSKVASTDLLISVLTPPWEQLCKYLAMHPEFLHRLEPRRFEELVAEFYRSHGWDVELTAQTRDGGYDIIAVMDSSPARMKVLIEAKRFSPERPVGVSIVRKLYGIRATQATSQLVLATSSYVSRPAKKEFERVVPWELDFLERDAILDWCRDNGGISIGPEL